MWLFFRWANAWKEKMVVVRSGGQGVNGRAEQRHWRKKWPIRWMWKWTAKRQQRRRNSKNKTARPIRRVWVHTHILLDPCEWIAKPKDVHSFSGCHCHAFPEYEWVCVFMRIYVVVHCAFFHTNDNDHCNVCESVLIPFFVRILPKVEATISGRHTHITKNVPTHGSMDCRMGIKMNIQLSDTLWIHDMFAIHICSTKN